MRVTIRKGGSDVIVDAVAGLARGGISFGAVCDRVLNDRAREISEPAQITRARKFIEAYFEKYAGVRAFIDATLEQTRRDQKVKTLFGRIRPIPDINSKNATQRGFAERTAVNTPLQGTAADLIKLAMIRIDEEIRKRGMKSRMTLQVHDELVFEVPESEVDAMKPLVREHMENAHALAVPLLVEIGVGPNWRDME